jgi:hypothetical protein
LSNMIGVAEVLIGAVGLVAAFFIYRWQRQRKGLGVAVLTDRPLLMTPSPFAVTVHHDGKVVGEPWLIVLRIANTGNVPIEASDFERPLSITFPYSEVLSAEVTGVRPVELTATLRTDGPTVTLDPCLLNPTDLIEVQCLLDGSHDLQVECRAVGVRSVETVSLPRDSWGKVWRVSTGDVVMLSLGPVIAIGLAVGLFLGGGGGDVFAGFVVLLGGLLWFWIGLRTIRRSRLWLTLPPPQGH